MDISADQNRDKDLLKKLERALFYEAQYRNAIVSGALTFFDINVSKDLIENDIFFKDESGQLASLMEFLGLKAPCSFTSFIEQWSKQIIPEISEQNVKNIGELRDILLNTFKNGIRNYTMEYWASKQNGQRFYIHHKFLLTKNEDGDICALTVVKDFTNLISSDERSRQKEIEKYAYTDPITQGYNYIRFKEKVNRQKNLGVIISMDIHSFKVINSICGIQKGDDVIKAIWESVMKVLDTDKGDIAGHINADHFAIFLPTFHNEKIVRKLKNITYALNFTSIDLQVPQLMPYFGISFWQPGKRIELSYSESVAAKKNAKSQQSTNYAFFEETDTARLVQEKQITDSFEIALARQEFKIWYQPKFSPINRRLVGAEALTRWQHEDGTLTPPGVFIPVFERNGMIRRLDEYIFRNVCAQQKKWLEEGKTIVPVSINLSRASLYYHDVVTQYKRIAEEYKVDTKFIPIEITETAAINNNDIKKIADDFYKAGFILHMDDFGSGYSSLASLNIMHFDTLKLDKSLIDYIGNFGGDRLIEHTISLAKELGIHVTAEGVENESQVSFLNHIGCDSIQGYYYSKPIPVPDFELLLDKCANEALSEDESAVQQVTQHITRFKHNLVKPCLYSFVINLTKDEYSEFTGSCDWHRETEIGNHPYQESVENLADNFLLPEYKEDYRQFMSRENIIKSYKGISETRVLQYSRMYHHLPTSMQLITNTFKVQGSDDLYLFATVTQLD